MPERIRCRHCGFDNGAGWADCFRCRRHLRDSPTIEVERAPPVTWGDHERWPDARRGPEIACEGCGAQTPERYAFCVRCGAPPRSPERYGHRRCPACERWTSRDHRFCVRCGDPMSEASGTSGWRPDGCPGCWADVSPEDAFCGECGAPVPADLAARRELLRELCARRAGGDYRSADRLPEMHPARAELVLREVDHVVWLALHASEAGAADIELAVSTAGDVGLEPPPGTLLRLADWILERLGTPDPEAIALRAEVEAFAGQERVLTAERAPRALRIRVAARALPSAKRLDAWAKRAGELFVEPPAGVTRP